MPKRLKRGLVQLYTGAGKGKSSAACGLALRACGFGLKVYILQFLKDGTSSEIRLLKKIKNITVQQCGRGTFVSGKPAAKDIEGAARGLAQAKTCIGSGKYDVIILDEALVALHCGVLKIGDVTDLITIKPRHVELILTGRSCPKKLFAMADLITKMKNIRHPFDKNIPARAGIEY
jgi:cob(I)alamin adenosyltransferase